MWIFDRKALQTRGNHIGEIEIFWEEGENLNKGWKKKRFGCPVHAWALGELSVEGKGGPHTTAQAWVPPWESALLQKVIGGRPLSQYLSVAGGKLLGQWGDTVVKSIGWRVGQTWNGGMALPLRQIGDFLNLRFLDNGEDTNLCLIQFLQGLNELLSWILGTQHTIITHNNLF